MAGRAEKVRVRPLLGGRLGGWGLQLKARAGELLGVRPLSGLRIRGQTLRPTHFSFSKVALFCDLEADGGSVRGYVTRT